MDDLDRASEYEERMREAALSHRKPVPVHTGRCLNCDKPSKGAFCDRHCGKDYEDREGADERSGLRMIEKGD